MFGILRPCRHRLSSALHADWLAHLCGLCLALRDEHGQLARTVTNYDGLVISVLAEAQSPRADGRRQAGPCPLRGLRRASVAHGEGARLAASVSLVLASAKLGDHVADGDGVYRRPVAAGAARLVAARFAEQGVRTGTGVGFDTAVLTEAVARQGEAERGIRPGDSMLLATEPTERATAAAFGHTAVVAGRPGNLAALTEAGRLFGRAAHLLDAVEDLAEDRVTGAWNPLMATGAGTAEARRLCDDAVLGVELALREAEFTDSSLVHALLVHELRQAVIRAFGHAGPAGPAGSQPRDTPGGEASPADEPAPGNPQGPPKGPKKKGSPRDGDGGGCWVPKFRVPPKKRGVLPGCAIATWMCCTCQFCCRDPHPGPWSGKPHAKWGCDCDCCDCCDTCDCCS
ncbi:DUF5685 family protein [Amycolatopsis nigrescens]|uniref:DUF5685 family protein n=1 Tax=Amycolatopsis nigrescens TaxID=381445 RepID=UPI00037CE329|nr:DUF5685 family protein [Amycolatopsis nigrescens]